MCLLGGLEADSSAGSGGAEALRQIQMKDIEIGTISDKSREYSR